MLFPRKLCPPIDTGDTRKDVLDKSAFIRDSPSATIVPLPIVLRYGVSCPTPVPKFDPRARKAIYVQVVLVEGLRVGNDRHDAPPRR
jgi:hypothetical protein